MRLGQTQTAFLIGMALLASLVVGLMAGGGLTSVRRIVGGIVAPLRGGQPAAPTLTPAASPSPQALLVPAGTRPTERTPTPRPAMTPKPKAEPTATPLTVPDLPTPTSTRASEPLISATPSAAPDLPTPISTHGSELPISAPSVTLVISYQGRVNLRAAPGTGAPIVGSVETDMEATVLGRNIDGSWLQVEVDEPDLNGWITASPTFVTVRGDLNTLPVTMP